MENKKEYKTFRLVLDIPEAVRMDLLMASHRQNMRLEDHMGSILTELGIFNRHYVITTMLKKFGITGVESALGLDDLHDFIAAGMKNFEFNKFKDEEEFLRYFVACGLDNIEVDEKEHNVFGISSVDIYNVVSDINSSPEEKREKIKNIAERYRDGK